MSCPVVVAKPTSFGDARIARFVLDCALFLYVSAAQEMFQREHSASIVNPASSYEQQSPAKKKNIIELDCRGLEFVEFKADVGLFLARPLFVLLLKSSG